VGEKQRSRFEIDALGAINATLSLDFGLVGVAINTKDFFALSLDERRWLTGGYMSQARRWKKQGAPNKPYFLAFQQAVMDAVKFTQDRDIGGVHLGIGEPVHFVFDQQHEYESSARATFNALKRAPSSVKERIGDIVFTSKLRAIPLQVADFIAYESFCYLVNRIVRKQEKLRSEHVSRRLFLGQCAPFI
jgi:hypothetical protein